MTFIIDSHDSFKINGKALFKMEFKNFKDLKLYAINFKEIIEFNEDFDSSIRNEFKSDFEDLLFFFSLNEESNFYSYFDFIKIIKE